MKFHLYADATFDAEDLDGAFIALSAHFKSLSEDDEDSFDMMGEIKIEPVPETLGINVSEEAKAVDKFGQLPKE